MAAKHANTLITAHNVPSLEQMKELGLLRKTAVFGDLFAKNRFLRFGDNLLNSNPEVIFGHHYFTACHELLIHVHIHVGVSGFI